MVSVVVNVTRGGGLAYVYHVVDCRPPAHLCVEPVGAEVEGLLLTRAAAPYPEVLGRRVLHSQQHRAHRSQMDSLL